MINKPEEKEPMREPLTVLKFIKEKEEMEKTNKNEGEMSMDSIFTDLGEREQVDVGSEDSGDLKDRENAIKAAFEETLLEEPDIEDKLRSLSDSLEVVNSLGFGEGGNIVVDKESKERKLIPTSQIVGYRVKNVGTEPIKYKTEEWKKGNNGSYESTVVEKEVKPGEQVDLTRQYMTMLCAKPEISLTLANGKVIRGSRAKSASTLKEELESYYFRFDRDEKGKLKQINDEGVKINVGNKVKGAWVVKDEFVETFGYLNNADKKTNGGNKKKEQFTKQDMEANYITKRLQEAGMGV